MTGYGRSSNNFSEKSISIEVRSVNSKVTDIRFKMPYNYREKELDLRKIINDKADRGKIDVNINVKTLSGEDGFILNHSLIKQYYQELQKINHELALPTGDILATILRMPNVVGSDEEGVSEEEWEVIQKTLNEALSDFHNFRISEGKAMDEDVRNRIAAIRHLQTQILPHEAERIVKLRSRLTQNLAEFMQKENVDKNRFEQEVLFYLEKIDITEEKVRLEQHCKYFLEQMNDAKNTSKGRTLNFIAQEIGREINTMGSKAYSSDIQHFVVSMKDELEKIKEQLANLV